MDAIKNAMTIDVEDYFQVSAFENHIDRKAWAELPCRVERNMTRIMALLDKHKVKATFFTLGWMAERYPEMIQSIVEQGHELASHGYQHVRVSHQTRAEFAADVRKTKDILESVGGVKVKGYRAASYSIGADNDWAHQELHDAGYTYSSSVYPIKHDHYGIPDAPRFTYRPIADADFIEIPITTSEILGKRMPGGGGGYFRFFPYWLSKQLISRVNARDEQSGIFYFHPWEIDPDQPRQAGLPLKTRFRHYVQLRKMESRLDQLLQDFQWDRMDRIFLDSASVSSMQRN